MRRVSVDLRGRAPEWFIFSARSWLTAVSLCLLTGKVGVIVEPPNRVEVPCQRQLLSLPQMVAATRGALFG